MKRKIKSVTGFTINFLRTSKGFTLEELSFLLKNQNCILTVSELEKIEDDGKRISFTELKSIMEVLDTSFILDLVIYENTEMRLLELERAIKIIQRNFEHFNWLIIALFLVSAILQH